MNAAVDSELIDACATYIEEYCTDDLARLADRGGSRLELSWRELSGRNPDLADDLVDSPDVVLAGFKSGLTQADIHPTVETHLEDNGEIDIVFSDFAERRMTVRDLRHEHVGRYVSLDAQVDTRTQVEPRATEVTFRCLRCETLQEPVKQFGDKLKGPHECTGCERQGPFQKVDTATTFEDHQLIEVSDPPEQTTGASDSIVVELKNDLTGRVQAGDRVFANGILETKSMVDENSPSRRRPLRMTAKTIESTNFGFDELTTERVEEIRELAERDDIYELLIGSIAPHILTEERGDTIKLSLALQLFGGVERDFETGYKRGNINVLLVGTPGTAKTQYLNAIHRIAPRSVKVSGKNARPAGMTATAVQSEMTGEWMLKAGALVKASGGIACIDEFDKMQQGTRASLHEALEDQEISVAKADINTTVPAKAAVLAAANPINGIFDRFQPLADQIDIGPTIISRFDLIFGLEDTVDEELDRQTARHQHDTADPDVADPEPAIDLDLLTQYVAYARQNVFPTYESDEVRDDLVEFYVETRQKALGEGSDDVRPVGARVNELLRRLAQASARARLSDVVTFEDTTRVKTLFRQTIGEVGLTEEGTIDGGKLDGGYEAFSQQELRDELYRIVAELEEDYEDGAPRNVIINVAEEHGADRGRAAHVLKEMLTKKDGGIYQPGTGKFRTT